MAAAQAARSEEQTARGLLISPPRGCRVDTWRPIGSHLHDSISPETTNKLLSHLLPLGIFIHRWIMDSLVSDLRIVKRHMIGSMVKVFDVVINHDQSRSGDDRNH